MMWIVGALYGGYVMANVLKWYWWRFNGYGYFWGMMAGIVSADVRAEAGRVCASATPVNNRSTCSRSSSGSPSSAACSARWPERRKTTPFSKNFYQTVRPWGFWGPIRETGAARAAGVPAEPRFLSRLANVVVGIVWQLCLTALPIYLVLRNWSWVGADRRAARVSRLFIKFNWYDQTGESLTDGPRRLTCL